MLRTLLTCARKGRVQLLSDEAHIAPIPNAVARDRSRSSNSSTITRLGRSMSMTAQDGIGLTSIINNQTKAADVAFWSKGRNVLIRSDWITLKDRFR